MRANHPSNTKRGGVCMYCKNYLPVIRRTDLSDLQECIVAEITVDKERCFLTCLYRWPRTCLYDNIQKNSIDENSKAGIVLETITLTAGYNQIINKPTHFTNVSASCIDLFWFLLQTRVI